jgi:hypothetical protein
MLLAGGAAALLPAAGAAQTGPLAATEGLGARFLQSGAALPLHPIGDFVVPARRALAGHLRAYGLRPRRGPFRIDLPRFRCGDASDALTDGIYVAVLPDDRIAMLQDVARGPQGRTLQGYFPPGYGMASDAPLVRLLADDRGGFPETGFNVFFGDRFAAVTGESVTIAVKAVETLGSGEDLLDGRPFILLFGAPGGACAEVPVEAVLIGPGAVTGGLRTGWATGWATG